MKSADTFPPLAALNDVRLALIAASYRRMTGKLLLTSDAADPVALWNAPRAIVAHGMEADPLFFYGNRLALQLFEMSFAEFTCLPSRLSVAPQASEARALLLERVTRHGFVEGYSGVRVASSGRCFTIMDTTVWNLLDESGIQHGQAAAFMPSRRVMA